VGSDFKVRYRDQPEVADQAARYRALDPKTRSAMSFNVVDFLVSHFLPALAEGGRDIRLNIVDDDIEEEKAKVSFSDGTLTFQNYVWQLARNQEPLGRHIVAHEMGHLALHRDQEFAFTKAGEFKLNFLQPEESAEWQANWFAAAFLLPDDLLLKARRSMLPTTVSIVANVSDRLVAKRLEQLDLDKRYRVKVTGDQCPNCGDFKVGYVGTTLTCQSCSFEIETV
jgi:Zn-dependent peptidase ImmA (M78 family)